ncbi:LytR/AlgR family response regulator transcription factor [Cellulophaga baltica]|uniref:Two component transcriptional regulator, LytTR family n=1 Tax=Cellulophaga baltica TaxID=76594 RepID=A0A1G7GDJ0_9FLAO|nr:LytTR family DNA-binding domain-containing protein [Cellulophaga baltica]MBA6315734.1 response regulator transcription factor [Cellulophaga baltica]SDE86151.1 two component transcriptional regulator, LytTR family [Cellulophaga baltica]
MMLQCIIADDEPIARQIIETYIQQIPNLSLVASCKDAFEVMQVLAEQHVDILFLDINMPKLSGLSLLKTLQVKPSVILTTAYSEYALEGFELAVTDYLLKPFSLERFIQATQKVQQKTIDTSPMIAIEEKEEAQTIFVKSDKQIMKINFDEIAYIEAYGNYIKIFTTKMILTPQTLTEFLTKLPQQFVRIHKSFVVNFEKIKMIEGNLIHLQNDVKLPIGKSFKKDVLERVQLG